MRRFVIMPDGGKWREVMAYSAEAAYRAEGTWYASGRKVGIYDPVTGKTEIFSRKLDESGNLLEIVNGVL